MFDAYKTAYTLAGLTLIGGKESDSIGWQIYHTKFAFVLFDPNNKSFQVFGETLTDGLLMTYLARAS